MVRALIASGTQMIERSRSARTDRLMLKRGSCCASVVTTGSPVSKTRRTVVWEGRIASPSTVARSIPYVVVSCSSPCASAIIRKARSAFITSTAVSRTRRSTMSSSSEELTVSATRPSVRSLLSSRSAFVAEAASRLCSDARSRACVSKARSRPATAAASAGSPLAAARSRSAASASAGVSEAFIARASSLGPARGQVPRVEPSFPGNGADIGSGRECRHVQRSQWNDRRRRIDRGRRPAPPATVWSDLPVRRRVTSAAPPRVAKAALFEEALLGALRRDSPSCGRPRGERVRSALHRGRRDERAANAARRRGAQRRGRASVDAQHPYPRLVARFAETAPEDAFERGFDPDASEGEEDDVPGMRSPGRRVPARRPMR